jgi:hypothetical protein
VADAVHGAAAAAVGTTIAAAGGGSLVLVGVVIAALLAPVFVRYKVSRPNVGEPDAVSEHAPNDDKLRSAADYDRRHFLGKDKRSG